MATEFNQFIIDLIPSIEVDQQRSWSILLLIILNINNCSLTPYILCIPNVQNYPYLDIIGFDKSFSLPAPKKVQTVLIGQMSLIFCVRQTILYYGIQDSAFD